MTRIHIAPQVFPAADAASAWRGIRPATSVALALALAALVAGCGGGEAPETASPSVPSSRSAPAAPRGIESAEPDSRGVVVRPDYAGIIARSGDTVQAMASRVGVSAAELAAYNGLPTSYLPKPGDELVLPPRAGGYGGSAGYSPVSRSQGEATLDSLSSPLSEPTPTAASTSSASPSPAATAGSDGWSPALVAGALDGDSSPGVGSGTLVAAGGDPNKVGYHDVRSGETVYSIARIYGVSPEALISWNALSGPNYAVAPGQVLVIPSPSARVGTGTAAIAVPGASSDAPPPPSAGAPLPRDTQAAQPLASPDLKRYQSDPAAPASAPTRPTEIASAPAPADAAAAAKPRAVSAPAPGKFLRPVPGQVVSKFSPGGGASRNDGVDFAASAGDAVRAAGDGVVALVSKSLGEWGNIVLVRHEGDLMTVYSRMGEVDVVKGAPVRAGDVLGDVAPASGGAATLHFEVRRGAFSENPEAFF